MVVLLKTTSVQVSFIQIMQIRVENKRKSVRKSRYVGDVSAAEPLVMMSSMSASVASGLPRCDDEACEKCSAPRHRGGVGEAA